MQPDLSRLFFVLGRFAACPMKNQTFSYKTQSKFSSSGFRMYAVLCRQNNMALQAPRYAYGVPLNGQTSVKSPGILRQAVKALSRKIITEILGPFFYQRLSNFTIQPKNGLGHLLEIVLVLPPC
jgi:hypothetical protein